MLWQLMRDTGLSMFAGGGILFVLSGIHRRIPNLPNPIWLRNIGDLMMLGGACLAVGAMAFGFLRRARVHRKQESQQRRVSAIENILDFLPLSAMCLDGHSVYFLAPETCNALHEVPVEEKGASLFESSFARMENRPVPAGKRMRASAVSIVRPARSHVALDRAGAWAVTLSDPPGHARGRGLALRQQGGGLLA
jgi:hypothetical protein